MLMAVTGLLRAGLLLILNVLAGAGSRLAPGGPRAGLVARAPACSSRAHGASASARLRGGLARMLSAAGAPDEPQSEEAFAAALELHARFVACDCPRLGPLLRRALEIFGDAFRLYGADGVLGSFNGGKDAVVIFHLMRAALAHHQQLAAESERAAPRNHARRVKPQLIYFHDAREFPEVEAFVARAVADADARLYTYEGGIVDGLREHIEAQRSAGRSAAFAFALGTREGDPNCKGQSAFAPSSAWMPPFMRVNPILQWDYGLVWQFLRGFGLPYCELYDRGYTSLGTRDDTLPNPALRIEPAEGGDGGAAAFRPAHLLSDFSLERAGRAGKAPAAPAPSAPPVAAARTAGLVVIGEEILKGQVADANGPLAVARLRARGLSLRRIAVVRDDLDEIAREVRAQSQAYDVVLTSGGVGPTHDDVTIKAVAAALGCAIEFSPQMAAMISEARGGGALSAEQEKMALLPAGSRLRLPPAAADSEPSASRWPIMQVGNVFVLPGVPAFFAAKLDVILGHFVGAQPPRAHTRTLVLSVVEETIVAPLNEAVAAHPSVSFGSYPADEPDFKTVVTLEGDDEAAVEAALAALTGKMSPGTVVRQPSKDLERMLN